MVKVPRFAFEKFPGADPVLTTHMKSVGEAMSIGRNFTEALGKAMRSMETKAGRVLDRSPDADAAARRAARPAPRCPPTAGSTSSSRRCAAGATVEQVAAATGIDPWFVDQIALAVRDRAPRCATRRR